MSEKRKTRDAGRSENEAEKKSKTNAKVKKCQSN